jgi:hypothetical protein
VDGLHEPWQVDHIQSETDTKRDRNHMLSLERSAEFRTVYIHNAHMEADSSAYESSFDLSVN